MNTKHLLALLALLCLATHAFPQGSLTPPAAPTPTMKTLDQIDAKLEKRTPISALPFTISTPGSYYVTGNLTGVANQPGIVINADDVTLDLNGFELIGVAGAAANGVRVGSGTSRTNATIRNGTLRGWTGAGVGAQNTGNFLMRVENVRVLSCGGGGIVLGDGGVATDCVAYGNTLHGISGGVACRVSRCLSSASIASGDGIHLGDNAVATDCVTYSNAGDGIQVGTVGSIAGCVSSNNTAHGFNVSTNVVFANCAANTNGGSGFVGVASSTLTNCGAVSNTSNGYALGTGSALTNCSASFNTGIGISTGDTALLDHCEADSNTGGGIAVLQGCSISHCIAQFNNGPAAISSTNACTIIGCSVFLNSSSLDPSAGISTTNFCHISDCVVASTGSTAGTLTSSTGIGIKTGGSCTIERCTVEGNKGDGIRVTNSCVVLDNHSDSNGANVPSPGDGAGIHTVSSNNRIEGNTVTFNDRGIDVDTISSLIVRNRASGNTTDYDIAASNRYGPIINIIAAGTAAVSGSSAASTLTSTDPLANYSY